MADFDGLSLFRDSLSRKTPEHGPALGPDQLAFARTTFPAGFVDMLATYGWGHYAQRRYQFLDPAPFGPLVQRLFGGDSQIDPGEVVVTGVEAFGTFTLWSPRFFAMQIDIHRMHLICADLVPGKAPVFMPPHLKARVNPAARTDPNNRARGLLPFEPEKIDFWDAEIRPLFGAAQQDLGPLEAGEIYAFDPPLVALNGALPRNPMDRMRRASAFDALSAAADIAPLRLIDRVGGKIEELRPVGS